MLRAVIGIVLALARAPAAFGSPPVQVDRFLVVLEPKADVAALDALEQRLRTAYQARTIARMTQGAQQGLLVAVDVSRASELERETAVASVVRVEAPGAVPTAPRMSTAGDVFQRSRPGWAIPGLYTVVLHERWGFGLELPPEQKALTGVARREALRERRAVLIREEAQQMAAQYGGVVRGAYAWDEPTFECAMIEEAALRMAEDKRVWRVRETIYILGDDPPTRSIREPSPAPTPWRP